MCWKDVYDNREGANMQKVISSLFMPAVKNIKQYRNSMKDDGEKTTSGQEKKKKRK